ncbi:MAG: peptidase S41 [Cyanothece sp. SIO1E1]|nr:peptidase S41 [Cyanothece sp. SIO1E1]
MTQLNQPETVKSPSGPSKLPESAKFLEKADVAVRDQLLAATDLPTFLESSGTLSLADRQRIVEQALVLLEGTYVHLPFKEAMHAIAPVQRLRLLQHRLSEMTAAQMPSEMLFHQEMTEIFTSCRDLHTNYLLPAPFNQKTAFLPFQVEEYFENEQPKYLVSRVFEGFDHPDFKAGVEVLYWNGVPITRAVEINADREAGSNLAARRARGIEALTIRSLMRSLPPDEEWVVVRYRDLNGQEQDLRFDWLIFPPEPNSSLVDPNSASLEATALANDIETEAVQQAKKILFAPKVIAAQQRLEQAVGEPTASAMGLDTMMPNVFRAQTVDTPGGTFGYIRIFTFNVNEADPFVSEFVRLAELLPQTGLILDVRGNGGGLVLASERLLQILTPRTIEPERVQFINTPLTLEICRQHAPTQLPIDDFDLSPWVKSIAQAVETGAIYSRGFPITDPDSANTLGQKYHGPVVLITDALCYSATDIFAAGFKDHEVGPILGTSDNTGAGGANVWTHGLLQILLNQPTPPYDQPLPNSPFKSLPNGASMRVSIRRTLRVGERSGTPVEDLGITPDYRHYMTKNDLLSGNVDLINRAGEILGERPVHTLKVETTQTADTLRVEVITGGFSRLDVFLDGRPQRSLDIIDGINNFDLKLPSQGASILDLKGFEQNRLVAARKVGI